MIFFSSGTTTQRADRILALLEAWGDKDACGLHIARAYDAPDEEAAALSFEHAALIAALRTDAEVQSLSRRPHLSGPLSVNATCLEEAYATVVAAIRDGVRYADAMPDWGRSFMDTLPQDGSYRSAVSSAEADPLALPPGCARVPLHEGVELAVSGSAHWIVRDDHVLCGPGKTAIRIAPAAWRGQGVGTLHCAAERLLNLREPQSQSSLTPGGYRSRSGAWDLLAAEARELGLRVADKGAVPDFSDLEKHLGVETSSVRWG